MQIVPNNSTIKLSTHHKKIIEDIFKNPVQADIPWKEIESLFLALGASISEGRGSRVRVELTGIRAVFHRPHPDRNTDKGAVMAVRRFLLSTGVQFI